MIYNIREFRIRIFPPSSPNELDAQLRMFSKVISFWYINTIVLLKNFKRYGSGYTVHRALYTQLSSACHSHIIFLFVNYKINKIVFKHCSEDMICKFFFFGFFFTSSLLFHDRPNFFMQSKHQFWLSIEL